MKIDITERKENLPHSFKMHASMCLELKKLVDKITRMVPDIEDARPGCSSGIQTLCLLHKALEKAKLLIQYCSESSKLYMAVTGDATLSRGCRAKKSLEQSLIGLQSLVPTVLAIKISQIVQDLTSTVLTLESSEQEAGKVFRDLMRRSSSSSVSLDEIRDFHFAALKLQISTPEAIVIERRSLNSLLGRLSESEVNKRQILKYLLCLLKKHERIICRDDTANSFPQHQSVEDVVCASTVNAECSEGRFLQDPAMKHTEALHNIDFSGSIASFGSSLNSIADLSCFLSTELNSSSSFDSPSYSKMSKGGYFTPMQTKDSDSGTIVSDSSHSEVEIEPLRGLLDLPWDEQIKVIEDVRSRFKHNTRAFRSMSPSKFLEPFITYLKNAHERHGTEEGIVKNGLDLLLDFFSGNRKAVESLEEEFFNMLSLFLESDVVVEEALNILEILSNHPNDLSKITSSNSLSSLLKIAETRTEHLQEQSMITLKNLSSSNEICLEMVSLNFIQKLTSFLQQNVFCKHSIIILRNLCNTERGRVCITETPDCLASIAELLDSESPKEQEIAISILLQLCVQKMEYCYLVVREASDIYPSLLLISNSGTKEAKVGASELLRALEEVKDIEVEEAYSRQEEKVTASLTSQVVTQEPLTITPSPKKSGLFGLNFSRFNKKKG